MEQEIWAILDTQQRPAYWVTKDGGRTYSRVDETITDVCCSRLKYLHGVKQKDVDIHPNKQQAARRLQKPQP